MKRTKLLAAIALGTGLVVLMACGGTQVDEIVTPTPTPTSEPTPTPIPASPTAKAPTATAVPPTATTAPANEEPSNDVTGDPTAGQQVFQSSKPIACSVCHSLDGIDGLGPSQQGIASRAGTRVSGLSAVEYIRESIIDPMAYLVEGFSPVMPLDFSEQLTTQQIDDVIAYLLTLE